MIFRPVIAAGLLAFAAPPTLAQLAPPAAMRNAIPLGTGVVPNPNGPEIWFGTADSASVRNTTEASLIPVLPDPARATGTAIVVAPGGGFMTLAWDMEGMQVAHMLADHGIAAFVLKYRLDPTPRDWPGFARILRERMTGWIGKPGEGLRIATPAYAVADGIAALKLVRSRAAEWRIDPARVGMMGFSAGARTTLRVTIDAAAADRPAFAGMLYPPMETVGVPDNAPPAFIAMATDDPLSGRAGYGLIESWIAARRPIEFHAYQRGGHGFGLGKPGTTTPDWTQAFLRWLDLNGFGAKVQPAP
ncbi:alpha/beta hydrolase [Sphingobium sp. CAP-1]|uniref:alpha/beta hydrolase n=1 Tax=Sphingobium sp. CAP-1 TaxID=2676077 RepID=UPI0012BB37D6|nr:alpha/beta hydrolase fold domain-containing protein [Sphingobium sp. CAP-1]QGP81098.1 alpha/beta hydrolase fold domain-containing protein [Sphingobium sp. CAP-1]